jgi:hypothetical protein
MDFMGILGYSWGLNCIEYTKEGETTLIIEE